MLLGEVYKRWGRKLEFKSLKQRILKQIGINLKEAKKKGDAALDLWMYLRNNEANEALAIHDLEKAKAIYSEILDELIALSDRISVDDGIATLNNNLAGVFAKLQDFDTAVIHYQKALSIRKASGDFHRAAGIYLNLGKVRQFQRQFPEAIDYSQKALKIYEDAQDMYKTADAYHQLAEIAREQRQFSKAIAYSERASNIYENLGDLNKAASAYHESGNVRYLQRQPEQALKYYNKVLKIYEDAPGLV